MVDDAGVVVFDCVLFDLKLVPLIADSMNLLGFVLGLSRFGDDLLELVVLTVSVLASVGFWKSVSEVGGEEDDLGGFLLA